MSSEALAERTQRPLVNLVDMAYRGEAVARLEGETVFVGYGIPGEEVAIEIFQRQRRYARARIAELHRPSSERVAPPCPYFGACGGCQWQHIAYPAQLEYKRRVVADQLRRIGGFQEAESLVRPTLAAPDPWQYRNHARFSVDRDGRMGFTTAVGHAFLPIDHCRLMHPAINEVLAQLQGRARVKHQVAVRYGVHTGQLLIQPQVPGVEAIVATGQEHYEEELLGRRFRISAASFFQVNTAQAERLVQAMVRQLEPTGREVVVDLYCGVGTFGLLLAEKVGRVIGIEESAAALKDARANAQGVPLLSGKGVPNIEFRIGKAEVVFPQMEEGVDAVILDPPRPGLRRPVIQALHRLKPAKIIYVSCEPSTLARDLRLLVEGGYALAEVQPVDLFPQTYHIESVTTLLSR